MTVTAVPFAIAAPAAAGLDVPAAFLVPFAGLLGLVVGSFLNVVVHRVPLGRSVVRPGSACPACGAPVRPLDNVPVVSWLVLRGRCRDCGERIGIRYPLVEVATGLAFAGVAWWAGASLALAPLLYLAAISIALALIDLDVRRLPDAIVLPSYPVMLSLVTVASLSGGQWWPPVRALLGGVALYLFYELLALYPVRARAGAAVAARPEHESSPTVAHMHSEPGAPGAPNAGEYEADPAAPASPIRPRAIGGGDIKLAGVLGITLGWFGWAQLLIGAFAGFLVGGLVGVALMALGRAGLQSRVPYGPSMLLGAWIGLLAGGPAAAWYLSSLGLA